MEEYVYSNAEVRAVHQRFVTFQAPFFDVGKLFIPTGSTYDNRQVRLEAQVDIGHSCLGSAEINGHIGTRQIGRSNIPPVVFVHNQMNMVSALEGKFLNNAPHFSVSE